MVRQISSRRGTSLVEVLIAMLIMILGFLSLHRLQVVTIRNNKYAAELTRAVQLAADRMEHLTGGSCADPPSGSITRGFFVVTWSTEQDTPVAGCSTVTVEAKWMQRGRPKQVRLARVVVEP